MYRVAVPFPWETLSANGVVAHLISVGCRLSHDEKFSCFSPGWNVALSIQETHRDTLFALLGIFKSRQCISDLRSSKTKEEVDVKQRKGEGRGRSVYCLTR